MEKKFNYYMGYILTIIIGVLVTPLYAVCIALIRSLVVLFDIISDSLTFMPRALFEYTKAYEKSYWKKEMDRINKKFKDN
jgi:hypothetical protein